MYCCLQLIYTWCDWS